MKSVAQIKLKFIEKILRRDLGNEISKELTPYEALKKRFEEQRRLERKVLKKYNLIYHVQKNTLVKNPKSKDKFNSLKYFIPSKRREEVIGDLTQTLNEMEEENFSLTKQMFFISWNIFMILFSFCRIKMSDFGKGKNEIEK